MIRDREQLPVLFCAKSNFY